MSVVLGYTYILVRMCMPPGLPVGVNHRSRCRARPPSRIGVLDDGGVKYVTPALLTRIRLDMRMCGYSPTLPTAGKANSTAKHLRALAFDVVVDLKTLFRRQSYRIVRSVSLIRC